MRGFPYIASKANRMVWRGSDEKTGMTRQNEAVKVAYAFQVFFSLGRMLGEGREISNRPWQVYMIRHRRWNIQSKLGSASSGRRGG